MFNNSGLSLEQAPPIEVVLRLFITGAIFGILFCIMLFFGKDDLINIESPLTLAIVHTFTIGVMASFMLGALFQMLPVLCGAHIKAPDILSFRVTILLIIGLIFLISAFLKGNGALYIFASMFLGYSLLISSYFMIKELYKIKHSNSSRGILIATISLLVLTILAILLLLNRAEINTPFNYQYLKQMHISFGLFGWISILIISVSFQVIEMFYVTKRYNQFYSKYLPITIISLLVIYSLAIYNKYSYILIYLIIFLIFIHAIITIHKLKNKKRAINDVSIYYWYLGMVNLILFFIAYIFDFNIILSALFFIYYSLSIVFAMSHKIVPFLVWFHLNAKGYFDAPMMHEIISFKYAKINFWIYLLSYIFYLLSFIKDKIFYIATFFLLISFCMLLYSIYNGLEKYNYVLKYGKKMDFNFN